MTADRAKLYPLLDAQLESLSLVRETLARNSLTDTERATVTAIRDRTLASLRDMLNLFHPPLTERTQ